MAPGYSPSPNPSGPYLPILPFADWVTLTHGCRNGSGWRSPARKLENVACSWEMVVQHRA